MFKGLQSTWQQLQLFQRLMKDDNVKALLSHPKFQTFMRDPAFQAVVKTKDAAKIAARLAPLRRDPELGPLLSKIDPRTFLS